MYLEHMKLLDKYFATPKKYKEPNKKFVISFDEDFERNSVQKNIKNLSSIEVEFLQHKDSLFKKKMCESKKRKYLLNKFNKD